METSLGRWFAALLLTVAKYLNAAARTTNRQAAALADRARKVTTRKGAG